MVYTPTKNKDTDTYSEHFQLEAQPFTTLLWILEYWNLSLDLIRLQLNSSWKYTDDLPLPKFFFSLLSSQTTWKLEEPHNTKRNQITFNASNERNPKWERNRRAVWNSCAAGGGLHSVTGSGKLFFRHSSSLLWSMEVSKTICWAMPFLSFSWRSSSWKTLRELLMSPKSQRSTKKTVSSLRKALEQQLQSTIRIITKTLSKRPFNTAKWAPKHPGIGELCEYPVAAMASPIQENRNENKLDPVKL